jgi:hypothetical protein
MLVPSNRVCFGEDFLAFHLIPCTANCVAACPLGETNVAERRYTVSAQGGEVRWITQGLSFEAQVCQYEKCKAESRAGH